MGQSCCLHSPATHESEGNKVSIFSDLKPLPYDLFGIRMPSYKADLFIPKQNNNNNLPESKNDKYNNSNRDGNERKYIIIGGKLPMQTQFYEMYFGYQRNKIEVKPFNYQSKNDMNNKNNHRNANLSKIPVAQGQPAIASAPAGLFSYITQDNKYLIVFRLSTIYNVFDITQEKWLITNMRSAIINSHLNVIGSQSYFNDNSCRCLFIDDKLLIISLSKYVHFINLTDVINPIYISQFDLERRNDNYYNYHNHGMCLVGFEMTNVITSI